MSFNQPTNASLVDGNDTVAKRGIFRNRTHGPMPIVRSKFTSNAIPMNADRCKLQSKNFSRRDQVMENGWKKGPPRSLETVVVQESSIQKSVESLVHRMGQCKLDRTTINVSETLLSSGSAVKFESEPCTVALQHTSQNGTNYFNKTIPMKANTFIKGEIGNVLSKKSIPVFMASQVEIKNDAKTLNDLKLGDYSQVSFENERADLLETEIKTYSASLSKSDQGAKDVINKFTESLNEKGNIKRKYDEELSLFNDRVRHLQRTKQLESIAMKAAISHPTVDLKSENENLKEMVKHLETKLAKRDLHIFNLKEVLALETNKIKELNKAQAKINQLQCDNIEKSREISVLRDELKYATKMRLESANKYDEKIIKLKKLLAIREYLLIKEKS